MDIVISIDLTDDDDIDPDVATSLLEPVAALLQGMAQDDRRALIDLFAECAQDEQDPAWSTAAFLASAYFPVSLAVA